LLETAIHLSQCERAIDTRVVHRRVVRPGPFRSVFPRPVSYKQQLTRQNKKALAGTASSGLRLPTVRRTRQIAEPVFGRNALPMLPLPIFDSRETDGRWTQATAAKAAILGACRRILSADNLRRVAGCRNTVKTPSVRTAQVFRRAASRHLACDYALVAR
jgi:hypothetical protein